MLQNRATLASRKKASISSRVKGGGCLYDISDSFRSSFLHLFISLPKSLQRNQSLGNTELTSLAVAKSLFLNAIGRLTARLSNCYA